MRTNIFAYTPPSDGVGLVPYMSLNVEEDGRITLAVRSSSGATSVMDVPEAELDRLALALQNRRLETAIRRLEQRLQEIDSRTAPMIRFGVHHEIGFHADTIDGVLSNQGGRGLRRELAEGGFIQAHGYSINKDGPEVARPGTRVLDAVSGVDLGPAD